MKKMKVLQQTMSEMNKKTIKIIIRGSIKKITTSIFLALFISQASYAWENYSYQNPFDQSEKTHPTRKKIICEYAKLAAIIILSYANYNNDHLDPDKAKLRDNLLTEEVTRCNQILAQYEYNELSEEEIIKPRKR